MIGHWVLFFWSYLLNSLCFICLVGNVFLGLWFCLVSAIDLAWSQSWCCVSGVSHTFPQDSWIILGERLHCLSFHVCVFVMIYARVTCRLLLLILCLMKDREDWGRAWSTGQVEPKGWLWLRRTLAGLCAEHASWSKPEFGVELGIDKDAWRAESGGLTQPDLHSMFRIWVGGEADVMWEEPVDGEHSGFW